MEGPAERKENRSGRCLRNEHEGLDSILKNNEVEQTFKQVSSWRFCEKLQGGHMQVTKEFALNFTGLNSKVGVLEFPISPEVISTIIEILSEAGVHRFRLKQVCAQEFCQRLICQFTYMHTEVLHL